MDAFALFVVGLGGVAAVALLSGMIGYWIGRLDQQRRGQQRVASGRTGPGETGMGWRNTGRIPS
jgi:hypothetical protein